MQPRRKNRDRSMRTRRKAPQPETSRRERWGGEGGWEGRGCSGGWVARTRAAFSTQQLLRNIYRRRRRGEGVYRFSFQTPGKECGNVSPTTVRHDHPLYIGVTATDSSRHRVIETCEGSSQILQQGNSGGVCLVRNSRNV